MFRRSKQGSVDVIHSTAPLNDDENEGLRQISETCLTGGAGQIVIDLTNVSLISSACLEIFVDLQAQCLSRGGAVKIAGANNLCRDILHITGVDEEIEVYGDVLTAAGSFAE